MKYVFAIAFSAALLVTICAAAANRELTDEKAKVNYSVGYQVGGDFKRQGLEINPEALLQGMRDALSGEEAMMSPLERRTTLINLQRRVTADQHKAEGAQAKE